MYLRLLLDLCYFCIQINPCMQNAKGVYLTISVLATERVRVLCCPPYYSLCIYIYIYILLIRFHDLGFGCHVGPIIAGSFGYADDVALVVPTLYTMDKIIKVCKIFADKIGVLFDQLKSKLLCSNVHNPDTIYVT